MLLIDGEMTEISSDSGDLLLRNGSPFFNERVKGLNVEIQTILDRAPTYGVRRTTTMLPSGSPCTKDTSGISATLPAVTGVSSVSYLSTLPSESFSAFVPFCSASERSRGFPFPADNTASLPVDIHHLNPSHAAPQESHYWQAMCRAEVARWMKQHLRSCVEPIANDYWKSFLSSNSLSSVPSSVTTSLPIPVRKEMQILHEHVLEVEQSHNEIQHRLDDTKLQCLDHYRDVQSSVLRVERQIEEAVDRVHDETRENISGLQRILNEVHNRSITKLQESIHQDWEKKKKEWRDSLYQQHAGTQAKLADLEERLQRWEAEMMKSLKQELEPVRNTLSDLQRQLVQTQNDLTCAIQALSEQSLLIQMLRNEKIVHRSEMRGCQRDIHRLEFVLQNFFSLHSTSSSFTSSVSTLKGPNHRNDREGVTKREREEGDHPLALPSSHPSDPSGDFHRQCEEEERTGPAAQGIPYKKEDQTTKENTKPGRGHAAYGKEEHQQLELSYIEEWKGWLASLQEQVNRMEERQRQQYRHGQYRRVASPEITAPPLFHRSAYPDTISHTASHDGVTAVGLSFPSPSPSVPLRPTPVAATSPRSGSSFSVRPMNESGTQDTPRLGHGSTFHTLLGSSGIDTQEKYKRHTEYNKGRIQEIFTPRARSSEIGNEMNRICMDFSDLNASGITMLDDDDAYPPPTTSDSESDRDNHHLSRLALD